jgi:PAS domain S-box-containing protein
MWATVKKSSLFYKVKHSDQNKAAMQEDAYSKDNVSFEVKLIRYLLVAALVPTLILMLAFWQFKASLYLSLLILLLLGSLITYCVYMTQKKMSSQLRSLANLLTGLSEGDYSMRGVKHQKDGALAELIEQINNLTNTMAEHRFIAHESQLLVTKVIQHIDVAIIAIDQNKHIALLNPAAEKLLATTQKEALGKPLAGYNATELLSIKEQQLIELSFAPQQGNYQVIHDHYREQGQQHDLYFITNVHGLLREHERQAWQNLIRVLSHEINNSLSPIASIASTLKIQATKQNLDSMYADNLSIISKRASSLKNFIGSYRQISFLPEPQKVSTNLAHIMNQLQPLFPHRKLEFNHSFNRELFIDIVQIEQVMINLIKNADEAMKIVEINNYQKPSSSFTGDSINKNNSSVITIDIYVKQHNVVIKITDQGTGIRNSENLFTPFYSTKKQGSGIGLLFSRQIIEAHGGSISMLNRDNVQGCVVKVNLPIS